MKQWICSDTHFGHRKVLLYEPERLRQTIIYMFEHIPQTSKSYTEEEIQREIELYKESVENDDKDMIDMFLNYHDEMLINKWNSVVGKEDMVYFLGDLTLKRNIDYMQNIISKLNGRKIMVMGNHDTRKPLDYMMFLTIDGKHYETAAGVANGSGSYFVFNKKGFEQVTHSPIVLARNGVNIWLMHEPPMDPNIDYEKLDVDKDILNANPYRWNPTDIFLFGHVHSSVSPIEIHKNVKCVCLDRNNLLPYDLDEVIKEVKKNMKEAE